MLLTILVAFFVSIALKIFLNWRRLAKVPGPFLAKVTDLWRAWYQYRGKLKTKLIELHEQHGAVVRYGVKSVSINDPGAVQAIYGSRAGLITADSYKVLVGISNGKEVPSLVSTADGKRHGALRRSVAGAFIPSKVLDYEPHMTETILELLDTLGKRTGNTIDLSAVMLYFTMDAAGRFSFGE